MKDRKLFQAIAVILFVTLAINSAIAQHPGFSVGERVEYKDQSYPTEVWKEGTIVKVHPEYHEVVVRWDPRDDYPQYTHDGKSNYEQSYRMDDVRPIQPKIQNNTAPNNGGATDDRRVNDDRNKNSETTKPAAANGGGIGLMTKQEIIDYMKTHGYVNGQPKHDMQVCRDLIELMKKRGVKEPLTPGPDDVGINLINANGCAGGLNTDVTGASVDNLGVPPTINWLAGTWTLTKFGDTVYSAPGDGYIYKQGPKMGTQGALTISTNGSYAWNDGTHIIKGTWRNATPEEMKMQGGTGIVLQNAAEGIDWLVFKYQSRVPNKTERVQVYDLHGGGSHRWIGWRK